MNNDHYVLIIKGSCPFCQDAISLLKKKSLNFVCTDMEFAPRVLQLSKESIGHPTVPIIYKVTTGASAKEIIDNEMIGGFDNLKEYLGVESGAS